MLKRAVLALIVLVVAGASGTITEAGGKPAPSPSPAAACTPAKDTAGHSQAQADLVMSSYCKNISPANIAGMTGISEANVVKIACANRPWPAGTQQVSCP